MGDGEPDPEDSNLDTPLGRGRIPDPLPALIDFAQGRGAIWLRLRTVGTRAVAQAGCERRDRRVLTGDDARRCVQALRDAAGLDESSGWAVGRLAWPGGPFQVEARRCLLGERASIRFARGEEPERGSSGRARQIQELLIQAVQRDCCGLLGNAGPENAMALRLSIESADLRSLVEAACDLSLMAAAAGDEGARELARSAGHGLAALMQGGQTEAAALLVRETRSLPRPETPFSAFCRRLLVAPLLAAGVSLPGRRELSPLR